MTHPDLLACLEQIRLAIGVKMATTADDAPTRPRNEYWMAGLTEAMKRLERRERKKDAGNFTPPTVAEIEEEMAKRGLVNGTAREQAQAFFDHHDTRGWKLKTGTMKRWQSAVGTWVSNFRGRFSPTPVLPKRTSLQRAKDMGIG